MSSSQTAPSGEPAVSPLVLADRLLTLARDADRAGFVSAADRMVKLAYAVYGEKPAVTA
jgi:hypothetical protein